MTPAPARWNLFPFPELPQAGTESVNLLRPVNIVVAHGAVATPASVPLSLTPVTYRHNSGHGILLAEERLPRSCVKYATGVVFDPHSRLHAGISIHCFLVMRRVMRGLSLEDVRHVGIDGSPTCLPTANHTCQRCRFRCDCCGVTQPVADHPHACGENSTKSRSVRHSGGPSPRVWGEPFTPCFARWFRWTIPTRVGRTDMLRPTRAEERDHPHACGENATSGMAGPPRPGPSPRVWGEPQCGPWTGVHARTIPTRVGRT